MYFRCCRYLRISCFVSIWLRSATKPGSRIKHKEFLPSSLNACNRDWRVSSSCSIESNLRWTKEKLRVCKLRDRPQTNLLSILGFFWADFWFFLRGLYQTSYTTPAKRIENRPKQSQNRRSLSYARGLINQRFGSFLLHQDLVAEAHRFFLLWEEGKCARNSHKLHIDCH